jgi:solute carrier family 35 protein F5
MHSMPLFFGFVGAFNVLALWPLGVILHFTGIEPFSLPTRSQTVIGLGINALITLCAAYLPRVSLTDNVRTA